MSINFPETPTEGYVVAAGDTVWQYPNSAWFLVIYQAADSGIINAGKPSENVRTKINGGNPFSVFLSNRLIDGGTP